MTEQEKNGNDEENTTLGCGKLARNTRQILRVITRPPMLTRGRKLFELANSERMVGRSTGKIQGPWLLGRWTIGAAGCDVKLVRQGELNCVRVI